jgi:hypothetical protein
VSGRIELGHGHDLRFADWDPDLDINPHLQHLAGQFPARVSAIVAHDLPPGVAACLTCHSADGRCEGVITFDTPLAREHFSGPYWQVLSWEPLTLQGSLECHCGDHGHIQDGRWVPA